MSHLYVATATLSIAGSEQDTELRARVELERRDDGMWCAAIRGPIHAHIAMTPATLPSWVDIDYLPLDAGDREHAEECLCELAMAEQGAA